MPTILYADAHLVIAAKPVGLITHPSRDCSDRTSLMTQLRAALGQWVYPVHRLDRATSGIIVFGRDSVSAAKLAASFAAGSVKKHYIAVIRGYLHGSGSIDKPLPKTTGSTPVAAITHWRALAHIELPWAVRPYTTARYTLVELQPITGRTHQIRKHLRSLSHPIIGDRKLGDGSHNQIFGEQTHVNRMLLHAYRLCFLHPESGLELDFHSPFDPDFKKIISLFMAESPGPWQSVLKF